MDMIIGESPMISGTWYNPKTGHHFTAKDTYMEDNRMYVLTTDGQRIDYEMLSQYVQSDNPQRDMKEFQKPKPAAAVLPPEVQSAVLPPEVANPGDDLLSDEDKALINGTAAEPRMGNPVPQHELGNIHQTIPEDEDTLLVRRMLKRAEAPQIDCDIVWKNFPTKQLDMLETMGVDLEKVAEFYIKDLNVTKIKETIKSRIVELIEDKLFPNEDPEDKEKAVIEKPESVEEKVVEPVVELHEVEPVNEPVSVKAKPAVKKTTKKTTAKKSTTKKNSKK